MAETPRFQKDDGRLKEGRYDGTEKSKVETSKPEKEKKTYHKGLRTSRVR